MKLLRHLLRFALVVVIAVGTGCVRAEPSAFDPEKTLADISGAKVRLFWTQDFGRERRPGGFSVLVPEASAKAMLFELRERLPAGYVAFVGTSRNLEDPSVKGVELVLAPGSDQFDILRLAATDGVNYGLETEDIVSRLKRWHEQTGIDIWQAETDSVQFDFKRTPPDPQAFARELYEFCPDVVDQGLGDMEALEMALREQTSVYLWWD